MTESEKAILRAEKYIEALQSENEGLQEQPLALADASAAKRSKAAG